jgi:hypothetical protein
LRIPFLAAARAALEDRRDQTDKPSIAYWRDHSVDFAGLFGTAADPPTLLPMAFRSSDDIGLDHWQRAEVRAEVFGENDCAASTLSRSQLAVIDRFVDC